MRNSEVWRSIAKLALAVLPALVAGVAAAADLGSLAVCSKCPAPAVFSLTGAGTEKAVAEARMTRAELADWCANWQPGDKGCVQQQLASEDLKKIYRASADCRAGSITPIDGKTYKLAGVWDNSDIGAGRSKWRDAAGKIVSRDNASGGLGISQQWELLCPGGAKGAKTASVSSGAGKGGKLPPAPTGAASAVPVDEFAVGQAVLARYGSEWVRGRVNAIRHMNSPKGPVTSYDVSLDNGKRGMVPQRMLRKAP